MRKELLKIALRMKNHPELAMMDMFDMTHKEMMEQMENEKREMIQKFKNELVIYSERVLGEIKSLPHLKGEKGEKGDIGNMPLKGKDYFTPAEVNAFARHIQTLVKIPQDGEDGKTPEKGKDYPSFEQTKSIVKDLVKQQAEYFFKFDENDVLKKLKEQFPKLELKGEEIIQKINDLSVSPEKQIDAKHIKNLPLGKGKKGGSGLTVNYSDLTSQCDGSNKTFTVPYHTRAVALLGTQFPIIYRPTTDYTISGTILTLTAEVSGPESGQTLLFLYG